jgi:hypothetical protein
LVLTHELANPATPQGRHWRSFLSRLVVAKSWSLTLSEIMLAPVPLTRVPKRLTTGWLINLLTSFAQPTKLKHNRWIGVGVNDVDTSSWLVTSQTRRVRCLCCWTSASPTTDSEVALTLVLMDTYITLMILRGRLMRLSLTKLENIALIIITIPLMLSPLCLLFFSTSGRLHSEFVRLLFYKLIGKLTVSLRCGITDYFEYRWHPCGVQITHSPITLANLSFINLVFIFRCSSSPYHPVYARGVDPSALAFSLSSHRHFIGSSGNRPLFNIFRS